MLGRKDQGGDLVLNLDKCAWNGWRYLPKVLDNEEGLD